MFQGVFSSPTGDQVLVEELAPPGETNNGLLLSDGATPKEAVKIGRVRALGSNGRDCDSKGSSTPKGPRQRRNKVVNLCCPQQVENNVSFNKSQKVKQIR